MKIDVGFERSGEGYKVVVGGVREYGGRGNLR
jgi:hypothetical protein